MANRRHFLAAVGGLGLGSAHLFDPAWADEAGASRDLYELCKFQIADETQRAGLDAFLRDAAIPAWNRIGVGPVGVFHPETELGPVYVLLRHRSAETALAGAGKLLGDSAFVEKGAALLDAPASKPAFQRIESALFRAFKGMPTIETPVKGPGRVFQLRIYESPSLKTGQKKIEMFNDAGEIAIFRRVGLNPVFFGECLIGDKMPNLTYMLGFEGPDAMKAAWSKFGADPDWKRLRGMAEYSDKAILSGITNLVLKPAAYSQV